MSIATRAWIPSLPAIALAACAASPEPASVVTLPVAPPASAGPAGPVATAEGAPAASRGAAPECASGVRGERCEGVLGAGEARALGPEIEAANQAMIESQYADARAIVRLAKLELRRDAGGHDPDGITDAADSLANAMQAMAVDDTSAEARLVLALALGRSLERKAQSADPVVRGLALDLVKLSLGGIPPDAPAGVRAAAGAFAHAVEGTRDPAAQGQPAHLGPEPLAPQPPPPPRCSPREAQAQASAAYCKGLEALRGASSRADHEAAARMLLGGSRSLAPLCKAGDPACPPHVAEGIAAASRAYQAAGRVAKSITAAWLVVGLGRVPGAAALEPVVSLEVADRYYAMGLFAEAAGWYERAARVAQGDPSGPAARALLIRVALGDDAAATRLAGAFASDGRYPLPKRAQWIVVTGSVVRNARGPAEVSAWIAKHQALIHQQGVDGDAFELTKPLPVPDPATARCASLLACSVRRLAGEPWTSGS
jgi:hypothetical protein